MINMYIEKDTISWTNYIPVNVSAQQLCSNQSTEKIHVSVNCTGVLTILQLSTKLGYQTG